MKPNARQQFMADVRHEKREASFVEMVKRLFRPRGAMAGELFGTQKLSDSKKGQGHGTRLRLR